MEDRYLLSIKRLNIDINYIQKSLLYLNSDVLSRIQIKDINGYDDLRLFIEEFSKFTESQFMNELFIHRLIILTLIKTTDFSILKKIKIMIENKYLNKNLSIKISDLRKYIIFNQLNINIDKLSKLYFELEDYYFENEYRRLELLKY